MSEQNGQNNARHGTDPPGGIASLDPSTAPAGDRLARYGQSPGPGGDGNGAGSAMEGGSGVSGAGTAGAPGGGRASDLAERSLADALKVSFTLLKVIMVLLVAYYLLLGGYQQVQSGQQVMRLWFGKIVADDTGAGRIYGPGPVYGLPYPIEERITLDVSPQTLDLREDFWFQVNDQTRGQTLDQLADRGGPLNPELDGSLITGDANLVHGQFQLTWRIADPIRFVEFVGDRELARRIVRNAARRGVVHAVGQTDVDEYVAGRPNVALAQQITQRALDELNTGIEITTFTSENTIAPLAVRRAYQAVSNAENEKATAINEARQAYNRTLSETAGEAATDLYELVQAYEQARNIGDGTEADRLLAQLNTALETGRMPVERGGDRLGGTVAQMLNEAKSYRTEIVERVKAEANQFEALLAEYRRNPRILTNRRWQDAREEVFQGDIERIYAPLGNLWIEAGADPEVMRERERQRLEEDRQRREEEGNAR